MSFWNKLVGRTNRQRSDQHWTSSLRTKPPLVRTTATAGEVASFIDAAKGDDLRKVQALLKRNPTLVFGKDNNGMTPLHWAARCGRTNVAKLLLTNRADVNAKDVEGLTPLYWAEFKGHQDLGELLRQHGVAEHPAPVPQAQTVSTDDSAATVDQSASFHDEVRLAALRKVEVLVKDNPDMVFSEDNNGTTPLHAAAKSGQKEVAELLLANGAKVDAKDKKGATPLQWALKKDYKEVAELLRQHGAKETSWPVPQAHSAAAVDQAASFQNAVRWAAFWKVGGLLEDGPDLVFSKDDNGTTPLHAAAKSGRKEVVELLLASGAKVDAKDNEGATPLQWAVKKNHSDVAELLREHEGHLAVVHFCELLIARKKNNSVHITCQALSKDEIEALHRFLILQNGVAQVQPNVVTIRVEAAFNNNVSPSETSYLAGLTVVFVKGVAITVAGTVARKTLDVVGDLVKEWLKKKNINDAEVVTLYNAQNQPEVIIQKPHARRVK